MARTKKSTAALQPNPDRPYLLEGNGFFANLFVTYSSKFYTEKFKTGNFTIDDLWMFNPNWDYKVREERLNRIFDKKRSKNPNYPIWRIIFLSIFDIWLYVFITAFISQASTIFIPLGVKLFVSWLNDENASIWKGLGYASLLAGCSLIQSTFRRLSETRVWLITNSLGMQLKALVYRVVLNRRESLSVELTLGKVANMILNDCTSYSLALSNWHALAINPFFMLVYILLLLIEFQILALIFFISCLLITCILMIFLRKQSRWTAKRKHIADKRGHLFSLIINNMKYVKFNNWEPNMEKKLNTIRDKEVNALFWESFHRSTAEGFFVLIPVGAVLMTFGFNLYFQDEARHLSVEETYSFIALIGLMASPLLNSLYGISALVICKVINKRIDNILKIPTKVQIEDDIELRKGEIQFEKYQGAYLTPKMIEIFDLNTESENLTVIREIDLKINSGESLGVVGRTGSGKSALLNAILGDLEQEGGKVRRCGKLGYVPQNPTLISSNIRDNIILGEEFNHDKFWRAVKLAQLDLDIQEMPEKELTDVGSNGGRLSGGQRQRINIARAIYQNSDIYLLDDCLSSLDNEVKGKIINDCFKEELKEKTVIFVTHSLKNAAFCDRILVMEEGQIRGCGTYEELDKMGIVSDLEKVKEIIEENEEKILNIELKPTLKRKKYKKEETLENNSATEQRDKKNINEPDNSIKNHKFAEINGVVDMPQEEQIGLGSKKSLKKNFSSINEFSELGEIPQEPQILNNNFTPKGIQRRLSRQFSRKISRKKSSHIYSSKHSFSELMPFNANHRSNPPTHKLAQNNLPQLENFSPTKFRRPKSQIELEEEDSPEAVNLSSGQLWSLYFNYGTKCFFYLRAFLYYGLNITVYLLNVSGGFWAENRDKYPGYYIVVIIGTLLFLFMSIRTIMNLAACKIVTVFGHNVNNRLISVLMKQNLSFFFLEDIGEILNSGVRHFNILDEELSYWLFNLQSYLALNVFLILIFCFTAFYLVICLILCCILIYRMMKRTIPIIFNLQKLALRTTDNMMTTVGNINNNIKVLSVYKKREYFKEEYEQKVREFETCQGSIKVLMIHVQTNFEIMGVLLIFIYLYGNVAFKLIGVGFLSSAIFFGSAYSVMPSLPEFLGRVYWGYQESLFRLESLAHINKFVLKGKECLRKQDESMNLQKRKDTENLEDGSLEIENLVFRYGEGLPLVIKNLSMKIEHKQRIGIVGRTGSGKSSLLLVISKLMKKEEGIVKVGKKNLDILSELEVRRSMEIIPQNPVLLFDTIRANIDPLNEFGDDEVAEALQKVCYAETVRISPNKKARRKEKMEKDQALNSSRNADLSKENQISPDFEKRFVFEESVRPVDLLEEEVVDGGEYLSLGQRQILCFAKALITKPKILILDEATANVDHKTDEMIQKLVRTEFENSTVIAVAHRVNTVKDFDYVIVMDSGKIAEAGDPSELLKKDSIFKEMYENMGG